MKYFLIKYSFKTGSQEEWHQEIRQFISALDSDPLLKGKISYRCMKSNENYFHLAGAVDEHAVKILQQQDFFSRYTQKAELVAGGAVEVLPLDIIAETEFRT